jgi:hypothetical protein
MIPMQTHRSFETPMLPARMGMQIVDDGLVDDADAAVKIASGLKVAVSEPSLERVPQRRRTLAKPIVTKVTRKPKKESVTPRFLLGWRPSHPLSIRISKTTSDRKTQAVGAREGAAADSPAELVCCRHRAIHAPTNGSHCAMNFVGAGLNQKACKWSRVITAFACENALFYLRVST